MSRKNTRKIYGMSQTKQNSLSPRQRCSNVLCAHCQVYDVHVHSCTWWTMLIRIFQEKSCIRFWIVSQTSHRFIIFFFVQLFFCTNCKHNFMGGLPSNILSVNILEIGIFAERIIIILFTTEPNSDKIVSSVRMHLRLNQFQFC